MIDESFKTIDGHGGVYEVSDFGNVINRLTGRRMAPALAGAGYQKVTLGHGARIQYYVHRLVASYFINSDESKPDVNHKNGIKTDNRAANLEWTTKSNNTLHAFRTGLMLRPEGDRHPARKINSVQAREIFFSEKITSELCREYGLSPRTIRNIKTKVIWKCLWYEKKK